jgi:hypothetical protein
MDITFEVKPGYINYFTVKFIYTITPKAGGAGFQWTNKKLDK